MDAAVGILLAFFELNVLMAFLLLLHGLRNLVGRAPFYVCLGALFVLIQLVNAIALRMETGFRGADFYVSNAIFLPAYLAAVMVVYMAEDTLTTHRLILGAMAALSLYFCIGFFSSMQTASDSYSLAADTPPEIVDYLLNARRRTLAGAVLSLSFDQLLIPIFFQRLRNLGVRLFFCILGALLLTQLVDTLIFINVAYWGDPQWLRQLTSSYIAKAASSIWLSVLLSVYMNKIVREMPGEERSSLDILFLFFTGYGKAVALQRDLKETQGRYETIIRNAREMIFILSESGVIIEANPSCARVLGLPGHERLRGRPFSDFACPPSPEDAASQTLDAEASGGLAYTPIRLRKADGSLVDVEASRSETNFDGRPVQVIFARDVTEQKRLAREKEELTEWLFHQQRLESMGRLAGGVAHDFNNLLHAIQGHTDILRFFSGVKDPEALKHIDAIGDIVGRASRTTELLLGFARARKGGNSTFDLGTLLRDVLNMFAPTSLRRAEVAVDIPPGRFPVHGNTTQLQQAFLNILINAIDAMEGSGRPGRISVRLSTPGALPTDWLPHSGEAPQEEYYLVEISDNGSGMDKETMERAFEPFFTTKPIGKGTGLGLALVYGTVKGHNGHVHVESELGVGTTFHVLLPRHRKPAGD